MNALELTQRQRKLLENVAKAAHQYQQAIADAAARLTHESEQIEQSRDKERQRIEEERRLKTESFFTRPAKDEDEKEQKRREQFNRDLQREIEKAIAAGRFTAAPPRHITTVADVKREINTLSSQEIRVDSTMGWTVARVLVPVLVLILLASFLAAVVGNTRGDMSLLGGLLVLALVSSFWVLTGSFAVLDVLAQRRNAKQRVAIANRILAFRSLYDRWLELVDEQAGAQRAEAQRRYEQAVAQAKGQALAAAEQLRLAIAEFSALTEPVSPPWGSEAWRRWEPGRLGPGAVRLGVFKMEV